LETVSRDDCVADAPRKTRATGSYTEAVTRGAKPPRHAAAAVPTEYSVPVLAGAVAGQRLLPFSGRMTAVLIALLASLRTTIRSRFEVGAEILALRHQLAVLQRTTSTRPCLRPIDRLLWVLLSSVWPNWRHAIQIVTPATVVRWHRRAFAAYWRWNSRPRRVGRPALAAHIRALIRQMHQANPLWGAPGIHGELQKLGIDVTQATVAKYLGRPGDPRSQSWRTFHRIAADRSWGSRRCRACGSARENQLLTGFANTCGAQEIQSPYELPRADRP
jgi:hypothetical protein